MKILNAEAIRQWDQYTIQHEPVSSIDLMERAAAACVHWLEANHYTNRHFHIYCGKGNNGGDGLAIARMLKNSGSSVTVYILEFGNLGTQDFQTNLQRLHDIFTDIHFIQDETHFSPCNKGDVILDCLLGTGLNRPLEGFTRSLVEFINSSGCEIVAIDIPTGLSADLSSKGNTVIHASHTLGFQCYKPAFLVAENAEAIGELHILDIGLHAAYLETLQQTPQMTDDKLVQSIYKPRQRFSHKGNFGHALLVAGGYGKMGAAVLATKACLKTGAGLTSVHVPKCGYGIMQVAAPEAMVMTDANEYHQAQVDADLSIYDAIGIGPGMGTEAITQTFLKNMLPRIHQGLVLDADALNIISLNKDLLKSLPANTIITPHPREFERLFGKEENDFDRIAVAMQKAKEYNIIIVLKGHHTFIATPQGESFYNATGNAGMAKGGTGDVLTGILTALIAQNYQPWQAAVLGVYLHGLAGDIAAEKFSPEAMVAGDVIRCLGQAFRQMAGS